MIKPSKYPEPYCRILWDHDSVESILFIAAQTLVRLPLSSILHEPKDRSTWWPTYRLENDMIGIDRKPLSSIHITMMDIVLTEWLPSLPMQWREIVWFRIRRGSPRSWRRVSSDIHRSHEYCRYCFSDACNHLANHLNSLG